MQTKLSNWKWLWFFLGAVILILGGLFLDSGGMATEPTKLPTDKSPQHSEVSGNIYRNTKYHFRIKFPDDWKVESGDGLHIVQKASSGNSTISISVQQLDLSGNKGFSSVKDAGSVKELTATIIEGVRSKFSDVKTINYGETKIDNEPAYWVEYSMSGEDLGRKISVTSIMYILAKGDTMYSLSAGTATNEYSKIKPIFMQSISTFTLEKYD